MAYIKEFICISCGKVKREVVHKSGICASCRFQSYNRSKRLHLASLKGLTIFERLERIEEYLYDLDALSRLEALEAKNITY